MTDEEKIAVGYIPQKLAEIVIKLAALHNGLISEIRLREERRLSLTVGGRNVVADSSCTADDIEYTVSRVCKGSLYSHSDSIRDGVITTDCGIRVGVSGRAVVSGNKVECVRNICSVNIRIPHRIKGAADHSYALVKKYGSLLIISLPGEGKTTILRELITLLSSGENAARVSVIDTRYELTAGMKEGDIADIYLGYPRETGIAQSVRTMSPEYIICDEISTSEDAEAILKAHAAGVKVIATAHSDSRDDLMKNKNIAELIGYGVFGCIYRIGEENE